MLLDGLCNMDVTLDHATTLDSRSFWEKCSTICLSRLSGNWIRQEHQPRTNSINVKIRKVALTIYRVVLRADRFISRRRQQSQTTIPSILCRTSSSAWKPRTASHSGCCGPGPPRIVHSWKPDVWLVPPTAHSHSLHFMWMPILSQSCGCR